MIGEVTPAAIRASEHHPRVGKDSVCLGCWANVETQMLLRVVSLAGIAPAADVLIPLTTVLRHSAELLHCKEVGIESIDDGEIQVIFVADAGNVAFAVCLRT